MLLSIFLSTSSKYPFNWSYEPCFMDVQKALAVWENSVHQIINIAFRKQRVCYSFSLDYSTSQFVISINEAVLNYEFSQLFLFTYRCLRKYNLRELQIAISKQDANISALMVLTVGVVFYCKSSIFHAHNFLYLTHFQLAIMFNNFAVL